MLHIGKKIKQVFERKGITVGEFAYKINYTRRNVYSIFDRYTIDTHLLTLISKALEYNFFKDMDDYIAKNENIKNAYHIKENGEKVKIKDIEEVEQEYKIKLNKYKKENEYLKEINNLLKEKDNKYSNKE